MINNDLVSKNLRLINFNKDYVFLNIHIYFSYIFKIITISNFTKIFEDI